MDTFESPKEHEEFSPDDQTSFSKDPAFELHEARRAALFSEVDNIIKDFKIHMADTIVQVTLPPETSRHELLSKINKLTTALYDKPAVDPEILDSWKNHSAFKETHASPSQILLNGHVENSTSMSRNYQNSKGLNDVDIRDLAVAHAAYLLINESDLFKGNAVRAKEGQLIYSHQGLTTKTFFGEVADPHVAASKSHSWNK